MFTTFVINLDKDTERMHFMHEQLFRIGIEYRRESAVLGKEYKPSPEEYSEAGAIKKSGHALLPGEVGCALSHARVIQKIVSENIPYALVLEDDVLLPADFKLVVETQIKKDKNWDYLLFDYVEVGPAYLRSWFRSIWINYQKIPDGIHKVLFLVTHFLKATYVIPMSMFEFARNKIRYHYPGPVIFFRPVYFAGAYLVTYNGAKKLHTLIKPVRYTADQLPNKARVLAGLKFRCYAPLIVSQQKNTFGSSILELSGNEIT